MSERDSYRVPLAELEKACGELANSRLGRHIVTTEFAILILRWERYMLDPALDAHPFALANMLVEQASQSLSRRTEIVGYGSDDTMPCDRQEMEQSHQVLFQSLWLNYDDQQYLERIEQYINRIAVNDLHADIADKTCIDFGCGHGNFAHALVRSGARSVRGIDYGSSSIEYAVRAAKRLKEDRVSFRCASVYTTGESDKSFDFAVQNGVFHHLNDEARAYKEVHRVLRPGGGFWVYTDGSDSIQGGIQDAAARVVGAFPTPEVTMSLEVMGLSAGKRYHLGDSLQATYRHTTPEKIIEDLDEAGFDFGRRLVGGALTDSDGETLVRDRWAVEKFGTGDIRMLFIRR